MSIEKDLALATRIMQDAIKAFEELKGSPVSPREHIGIIEVAMIVSGFMRSGNPLHPDFNTAARRALIEYQEHWVPLLSLEQRKSTRS